MLGLWSLWLGDAQKVSESHSYTCDGLMDGLARTLMQDESTILIVAVSSMELLIQRATIVIQESQLSFNVPLSSPSGTDEFPFTLTSTDDELGVGILKFISSSDNGKQRARRNMVHGWKERGTMPR